MTIRMVVIAAMDRNGAIGKGNAIPWNVPEDLARFKERTMDHCMIMGRKTWESFNGRALPGRPHIIVSSDPDSVEIADKYKDRVTVVANLDVAIEKARSLATIAEQEQFFVIGGANIYAQVIDKADIFDITIIDTEVEDADTFFPRDALNERLAGGEFMADEYWSTLGYSVVSDSGIKFEHKCLFKHS